MAETAKFQLRLTGGLASTHQFEAYDGFTSLAGAAWTLCLVTNYVETGQIRHRGDFVGRHAVLANPMSSGSLLADFRVALQSDPRVVFGRIAGAASPSAILYGLVKKVVDLNTGHDLERKAPDQLDFIAEKSGDIEALANAVEPSLRRAHDVIGDSAREIEWIGGFDAIATMDSDTKSYMSENIYDSEIISKDVTVTGFYGNTGNGSVFDHELGHNVRFKMDKRTLNIFGSFFSWGLHQYVFKTNRRLNISFTKIVALDGRVKQYVIVSASEADSD